jgi:hypothetical protein
MAPPVSLRPQEDDLSQSGKLLEAVRGKRLPIGFGVGRRGDPGGGYR